MVTKHGRGLLIDWDLLINPEVMSPVERIV